MSLRLTDVAWSAGEVRVLDGVTAAAPGGRLTGLLGPNGAGKSTLLRVVGGVLAPDAGSVHLDGADLLALPRRERARRVRSSSRRPSQPGRSRCARRCTSAGPRTCRAGAG